MMTPGFSKPRHLLPWLPYPEKDRVIINGHNFTPATLLLDDYPTAAMAFSVYKIRTAYAGFCLRVRRSSDNTTSDIGFVSNQLDTAALLSFVGAGNGFVDTWYDQSGNGRNATNASAGNQPRIVNSGVVETQGARPAVRFLGTSWLKTVSSFTVSQPTEHFIVHAHTGGYLFDASTSAARQAVLRDPGKTFFAGGSEISTGVTNNGSHSLYTILFSGASSIFRRNGTQTGAGNPGTAGLNGLTIGARNVNDQQITGTVQEFIVYPASQSAVRSAIETNINSRYGVF